MWTDVINLRGFQTTSLGEVAQQAISRRLRKLWPNLSGLNVPGIGYGVPYVEFFMAKLKEP